MHIEPLGFVLLVLSIWFLGQAIKMANRNKTRKEIFEEASRLKRLADFRGGGYEELNNFFSSCKNTIYKTGLFIVGSNISMLCVLFFTLKVDGSRPPSSIWFVALVSSILYIPSFVFVCLIPFFDIKDAELGELNHLKD